MIFRPNHKLLLVIVGPTAVGKTALSLRLAGQFDGEVISADSRLIYRRLDIGTAKPTPAERAAVTHYLIDICDPNETITLAEFQRRANRAIESVQAAGKLPILVGGTGQYVKAIIEGWRIPEVAPHPHLRQVLGALGQNELSRWLSALDPVAAAKLDPRNVRRVVRALEVTLVTGQPVSELQRKIPPPYHIKVVGLMLDRHLLYQRIDSRVDEMMRSGLLAEVQSLRDAGYDRRLPAMSGLGYRQLWAHLAGEITLEQAIERIKFETHRFVRQQSTWFREDDNEIAWFDAADPRLVVDVGKHVEKWAAHAKAP